ncbi:hypothetical protein [Kitasatospora sp. NPDC059327]|uniref:hypothetical protein n=1 Tax=Kitasatospora sp. NPDC059327 TaxID=3346803 RepID=UPI0036AA9823
MDRPLRLLQQDRVDFEHALSRALSATEVRDALTAAGPAAPGTEDLRALVRGSTAEITAAVGTEFERYAGLRASAAPSAPMRPEPPLGHERAAGVAGVMAVLVPLIAGTAAAILFVLGQIMDMVKSQRGLGGFLISAAALTAAIAGISMALGLCGLLVEASRRRAAPPRQQPRHDDVQDELQRAREAWRTALLEHGLIPFLLSRAQPSPNGTAPERAFRPAHSRPDFDSPGFGPQ